MRRQKLICLFCKPKIFHEVAYVSLDLLIPARFSSFEQDDIIYITVYYHHIQSWVNLLTIGGVIYQTLLFKNQSIFFIGNYGFPK